jgi:hypothetical protein
MVWLLFKGRKGAYVENLNNDKEQRISEINDEIAKLTHSIQKKENEEKARKADFLKYMHDLIDKNPNEFRLKVCSWILDSTENRELDGLRRAYGYLADFVRRKLERKDDELSGFVSAKDWIESQVRVDHVLITSDYNEPYLNMISHTFFQPISDDIENHSAYFSHMVYFGVPLYIYDKVTDQYSLLDEKSEQYCYLKLRGKYYEGSSSMPDWAYKIYINIAHVDWHYKLDNDSNIPKNEDEVSKLRIAYRNLIGVTLHKSSKSGYGHNSKLYHILQNVVERYYGNLFDINDSDTWAKQKDVIEWLKSEHGLSEREATAIDLVTRPDEARKK